VRRTESRASWTRRRRKRMTRKKDVQLAERPRPSFITEGMAKLANCSRVQGLGFRVYRVLGVLRFLRFLVFLGFLGFFGFRVRV